MTSKQTVAVEQNRKSRFLNVFPKISVRSRNDMREVLFTSVFRRFVSFCLSSRVSDSDLMFGLTFLSISFTFAALNKFSRFSKRKINNKTRYAGFFILIFYYKYWKFYELSGFVRENLLSYAGKPLDVFSNFSSRFGEGIFMAANPPTVRARIPRFVAS